MTERFPEVGFFHLPVGAEIPLDDGAPGLQLNELQWHDKKLNPQHKEDLLDKQLIRSCQEPGLNHGSGDVGYFQTVHKERCCMLYLVGASSLHPHWSRFSV